MARSERAISGRRLAIIPGAAITDPSLALFDLQVLLLVSTKVADDGGWQRDEYDLSRQLQCGTDKIHAALDRLIDAGYIERRSAQGEWLLLSMERVGGGE